MNIEPRQPALGMSAPAALSLMVHVLDDDDAVRRGISLLLQSAGIPAVTHVSGVAFLESLPDLNEAEIGCVLTDVRMPGLDGVALLEQLKAAGFSRPRVGMTAHGDIATAVRAMKAGAVDFIEKPFDDETLLAVIERSIAIHDAGRDREGRPGASSEGLVAAHPEVVEAARRMTGLSPREREVLELLVTGKPNKLIAHELGISQRTAEVHRARLMARLGVRSLAEAVRLAITAELADDTVRSALAAAGEDDDGVTAEAC
jgi:two-component system response regulator FixJ